MAADGSAWRGPSPGRLGKLVVRILRHLTRRVAVVALALGATAGVAAATVGPTTALGQVFLVVVGLLISVVVLPETPHRLWNVTVADLADTVPSPQLLDASRSIARAIARQAAGPVSDEAIAEIWEEALRGVGAIVEDASRLLTDVSYRVQITPEGAGPPVVATSISSMRCVPGAKDQTVWFSFCSGLDALNSEFAEQGNGCIGRELVDPRPDEDLDEWTSRVANYGVSFIIDGHAADRQAPEIVAGEGWRVVRVPFEAGALCERRLPTELTVEFHADPTQRRLPVKFGAYYVVGATQITFEVADPDAEVWCDEYLAHATQSLVLLPQRSLRGPGYLIRASAGTVLPPGAGAVFSWTSPATSSAAGRVAGGDTDAAH